MLRKIELKTFEDVKKLNAFAMTCPYDTFVHSGNDVVDAKSLMGLFVFMSKNNLMYVVPDDVNPKYAFSGIKKFIIN